MEWATPHPEPPPAYDPNDPEQVERRQLEEARRQRDVWQALGKLLADPAGRQWIWGLLERCHMFRTSFHGEATHATAFSEGERNIGLMIQADVMKAAPGAYEMMQRELGA